MQNVKNISINLPKRVILVLTINFKEENMSREPRRMEENVRGSSRLIVYIAVAAVIAILIISYIIIANIIENKREEQRLAELENAEKQMAEEEALIAETQNSENEEEAESVSTQIGKTVEESSKER